MAARASAPAKPARSIVSALDGPSMSFAASAPVDTSLLESEGVALKKKLGQHGPAPKLAYIPAESYSLKRDRLVQAPALGEAADAGAAPADGAAAANEMPGPGSIATIRGSWSVQTHQDKLPKRNKVPELTLRPDGAIKLTWDNARQQELFKANRLQLCAEQIKVRPPCTHHCLTPCARLASLTASCARCRSRSSACPLPTAPRPTRSRTTAT